MQHPAHHAMQKPTQPSRPDRQACEILTVDFSQTYRFEMDDGLSKWVTVSRAGRRLIVTTGYKDGLVVDETSETFEADGAIRVTLTETGLYLASHRELLAGRVRLQRTRFF